MADPVTPVFKAGHTNEQVLSPGETDAMPLPIFIVPNKKHTFLISRWKLSADELAKIIETGEIYLVVDGQTHPPVIITPCVEIQENGPDEVVVSYRVHNILEELAELEDKR